MKNLVLLFCALMAGVLSNNANAQSPAKFAFVSVEEVVQLLPEYKKSNVDTSPV